MIIRKVEKPEDGDEGSEKPESQTKDPSKQKAQAQKDKDQQQGKAGEVRSGESGRTDGKKKEEGDKPTK